MRFERLDLNLLVALDALLESRSVTLAAQRICISQSGMTGALNRLRHFFGDDLLVNVGRRMMLTPRAQELEGPVRDALLLIRSKVTTPLEFDPATSDRNFRIIASDYAYDVMIADVLRDAAVEAPGVTFDISPPDDTAFDRMGRGEVDILMTLENYMPDDFPKRALFEDEHVVVCWEQNRYCSAELTQSEFLKLGHVVAYFGPTRQPAYSEIYFTQIGVDRRIEVRVPTFSVIPHSVIGTDRIATMYLRHAVRLATRFPLRILPMPFPIPNVWEAMQWHNVRQNDKALHWLLGHIEKTAATVAAEPRALDTAPPRPSGGFR